MEVNGHKIQPFANLSEANLYGADLSGANLYGANLSEANLSEANLYKANLYKANLYGADLYKANLYGADLYGANLSGANLYGANLYGADLSGANLYGANLSGANNIPEKVAVMTRILPDEGDVIGWKKCQGGVIVKLLIKGSTPRSNATGRKCRAREAIVLEVVGADVGISNHDNKTTYKVGETVVCDHWEVDRWKECAGGIHFFITRQEAEGY